MSNRIVFGLMSSYENADCVRQLVNALSPYRVLVHHDSSKGPDPCIDLPNVRSVPDPALTGWGSWGFSQAILRTLTHALERHDFDYFQLLSPSCLPIRPLADFQAHVNRQEADIHADLMPVDTDDTMLMNFGYRTYLAGRTVRFRLLRRARGWYFGDHPALLQTHSLSVLKRPMDGTGGSVIAQQAGLALTWLAAHHALSSHPFGAGWRPMIGSTWFGARRKVCEHLVDSARRDPRVAHFRRLHIVDETMFPTMLGNSGFRLRPSNHAVNAFDSEGHPRVIAAADLRRFELTGRFFARKFAAHADDPARQWALEAAQGSGGSDRYAAALDPAHLVGHQDEDEQGDRQAHAQAKRTHGVSGLALVAHHEEER